MQKLDRLLDSIRESEAYNQLKAKYDELDSQTKLYIHLGSAVAVVLLVFSTILYGVAKLNGFKSEINEREELIGYLQRSADTIKQLKAQMSAHRGSADTSSPLPTFIENLLLTANLDRSKVEIGTEHTGSEDKESREILLDITMKQVNLRQILRLMFAITEQGSARNLNIKDINVDTKGDPTGYMDAVITVANFKAK